MSGVFESQSSRFEAMSGDRRWFLGVVGRLAAAAAGNPVVRVGIGAGALGVLEACGKDGDRGGDETLTGLGSQTNAQDEQVVDVIARDDSFEIEGTPDLTTGDVTFEIDNRGDHPHQAQFMPHEHMHDMDMGGEVLDVAVGQSDLLQAEIPSGADTVSLHCPLHEDMHVNLTVNG